MTPFVHLHVHTQYSLLDGFCRIKQAVARAKELDMPALAMTDHGVMYGAVDFYREAKKAGIKPIIGCEVYVAPRTRFDKVHDLDSDPHHLVLLCKNETGYKNLIKMVSASFTEGFYSKPRVDIDLLAQHSEGLICLSACLAGEVAKLLVNGSVDAAKTVALKYQSIFGEGNYYLEIQDHAIPDQIKVNGGVARLSAETGIPMVCTNDAHYVTREEARLQDILLCIQTGKTLDDPDRMRFDGEEFYLKSGDEMEQLFGGFQDAVANTLRIAERCNYDFEFGKHHLPKFDLPDGYDDAAEYLKKICYDGFVQRYPDKPESYIERLEYELSMISDMGFTDYFLIVSDFIAYARRNGIPVGPGRGSGAASVVAYSLRITDVDPMKYDLFFERFLNPERVTMPDFDIDFCPNRRQEVIDYVIDKYGADNVAQIITFGTMAARAAIRDVARVMGMTFAEGDVVAKLVPAEVDMTISRALKASPPLRELYENDERTRNLIDTAQALEGTPRNCGTHAAGIVITQTPVTDYVPLSKNDEAVVCQFTMVPLEELGLLKMDFLGLRNLTVIDDAQKLVQQHHPDFDIEKVDENDAATYEMLSAGDTVGIFQMESQGMTALAVQLRPHSVEEITALVALYRPGPMENIPAYLDGNLHPERIKYATPHLEPILNVTFGVAVYQEQVLDIFRRLAGYSLGRADEVRRAMSKKYMDVLKAERQNFIYGNAEAGIAGCVANGIPDRVADALFDDLESFASYAFNKAHSVSYAVVCYRTAYLKRHHPKEYMAALLTSVLGRTSKVVEYIAEAKRLGISVLLPDINESFATFVVAGDDIRFGLVAVKNIGSRFIQDVVQEREQNGAFTSFQSFCERMSKTDINRRAVESLIKCGACDTFGRRSQMLAACGTILENIASARANVMEGQIDFFSMEGAIGAPAEIRLPDLPEFSGKELVSMEKEVTGLYLSGHPLDEYAAALRGVRTAGLGKIISSLEECDNAFRDGQEVTVAGIIAKQRTKATKTGAMMAYLDLEDETALIEVIVFPKTLERYGSYAKEDAAVLVKGRLSTREDRPPQLISDQIRPLSELGAAQNLPSQTLYVKLNSPDDPTTERVKPMLKMFHGNTRVVLYFQDTGTRQGTVCEPDHRLLSSLRELLGEECVVLK